MKIKFLMIGLLGLSTVTAFAQKGVLRDAQESYDKYTVENSQKILAAKAKTDIADAKTSIDKASTNDKTATLPQTYALIGAIYSATAAMDTTGAPATATLITTAQEAIKKAKDAVATEKDADIKAKCTKLIADAGTNLAIYFQAQGVKQYQSGKFELAYQSFDNWSQATGDTTATYYAALAASNAGNTNPKFYPYAISSYNKLLSTNYSQNAKIYGYQATLYIINKDTANALKVITDGVTKFPSNADLRGQEIKFYLMAGKDNEIIGKLESAVAADPKNKELCFYAGLSFTRVGDASAAKAAKAKDAAAKAADNKAALDYYSKAADYYKKAIAIDPNYLDANLNLGEVMMKPAIDFYNAANSLPSNATQKQYDEIRAKADVQFDLALPYLQKAVDLDPKSNAALTNLWNYYRGKYDKAHAAENKAKAADIKKQIDALPAKN
jgi:tetratricopeptide (TPR) repeat protein